MKPKRMSIMISVHLTENLGYEYDDVYTAYEVFYRNAVNDVERAKKTREYGLDMMNHPNWFDASYISWLSYDSLNVELPDRYCILLRLSTGVNTGRKTDA